MIKRLLGLGMSLALALASTVGLAQDYPTKPVKLMVPYAAGGTPDSLGRVIALRLSEAMGQQFVVENRPGAGGIPATVAVARAPADGATLLVADVSQLAINPYLFQKLPYDPVKDFAPISLVAVTPLYVVAHPSTGITSFKDFVTQVRAQPGRFNYGSAGIGSIHHIAMESLKAALGLDIVHVPYKGSGQSVPAFIGGDLSFVVSALPALAGHIKQGRSYLLASTGAARSPQTPEVPSVGEFVPGYDFASVIGILAPTGTPPAILTKLAEEIAKVMKQPDTVQRFTALGSDPISSTPAAYAENIRRSLDRFARAVPISGAKAE